MCNLSQADRIEVERVSVIALKRGVPFTGHDIYNEYNEGDGNEDNNAPLSSEISAYVREIFNRGDMPGWASTQVVPKTGPVLYFKITGGSMAGRKAKEIRKKIEQNNLHAKANKLMESAMKEKIEEDGPLSPVAFAIAKALGHFPMEDIGT